jgi:hypothetical protein
VGRPDMLRVAVAARITSVLSLKFVD